MEKELIKNYKFIESGAKSLEEQDPSPMNELDKENVREILHDVLTEL